MRPLRDGEEPVLTAAAGRTMTLALEEGSEGVPPVPPVINVEPIQSVPSTGLPASIVELAESSSTESVEDPKSDDELEEASHGSKRKQANVDVGVGPSKRRRVIPTEEQSSFEEDASHSYHVEHTSSPK